MEENSQIRILHIHNIRWWNATSNYAFNLIVALKELGFEQFVISGKENPINERLSLENIPFDPILPDKDIHYIPLYLRNFDIKNYDIIITYWGRDQQLFNFKKNSDQKLFRVRIDAREPRKNKAALRLNKKTDLIIFPSQIELNKFKEITNIKKNLAVLEGTFPRKTKTIKQKKIAKLKILNIARTSKVKGHKYLLEALSLLKKEKIPFETKFIGNICQIPVETLEEMSEKLGILPNVSFLGYVESIEPFLNWANLGIVSSIGSEVFSRALYEYFSYYLPVVATDVGIIPEVYSRVDFGALIGKKNPEEIANGIKTVWKNYITYSENIRDFYESNLTFSVFKRNVALKLFNKKSR